MTPLAVHAALEADLVLDEAEAGFGRQSGWSAGTVLADGLRAAVGEVVRADVNEGAAEAQAARLRDDGLDGVR